MLLQQSRRKLIGYVALGLISARLMIKVLHTLRQRYGDIPVVLFSVFLQDLKRGKIQQVLMGTEFFQVLVKESEKMYAYKTAVTPMMDRTQVVEKLAQANVAFGTLQSSKVSKLAPVFITMIPFVYLLLTYRMMGKLFHGSDDGVGKSTLQEAERQRQQPVSFQDVAGIDEAKAELEEIVDALRNPQKYHRLGAKMPRGILLCGPSGTGKTLLARALSHEADIPFMSCSASDFVEMLVGRGAARVRELFTRASKCAPSIIFVDELDALAKARGGLNSNDEREQTLNQLLTEMDGFDGRSEGVIVVAATNRPHVLDPALCRAGRFDRHVYVGLPNASGREAILQVHCRRVPLDPDVNLRLVALRCPGTSGAELAKIVNEAALMAVRNEELHITMQHFEVAIQRSERSASVLKSTSFVAMQQPDALD